MSRNCETARSKVHRFQPSVEPLEGRLCLSVTVTSSPADVGRELKIIGDDGANHITIVNQGNGHVEVTNAGGKLLGASDNVSVIRVNAKGGKDTIAYQLSGPLEHAERLFFNLGAGADDLSLDLAAGISGANLHVTVEGDAGADTIDATIGNLVDAKLVLDVDGGAGDDNITVSAAANVDVDSVLKVLLDGNEGKDIITGTYTGVVEGKVVYDARGNKGSDTLVGNLTATVGSTGTLRAVSRGGKGLDNVTLNVTDETLVDEASTLAALKAKIVDKTGLDTLTHTDNVEVVGAPVV